MQDDPKNFLTIQEAAEFLKVSKTSLRRWSNSGKLPCFRVGTRNERRFQLTDLISFMSKSEPKPSTLGLESAFVQNTPQVDSKPIVSPHHISSYYRNESEQWQSLMPYLSPHLTQKARTIYIYNTDQETLIRQFSEHGFDPKKLQQEGTLHFISSSQSYLLDGVFIPERMLKFWQKMIGQAMLDGIEKIMLTGEMDWALSGFPGSELLCSYEIELDQFLANFPMVTVVCQYPLKDFSGEIIFDSMCAHPHLQVNEHLVSGIQI